MGVKILHHDFPFSLVLVPGRCCEKAAKFTKPMDIMLLRHADQVSLDLWAGSIKLRPLRVGLKGQLVGVAGNIAADTRISVVEARQT